MCNRSIWTVAFLVSVWTFVPVEAGAFSTQRPPSSSLVPITTETYLVNLSDIENWSLILQTVFTGGLLLVALFALLAARAQIDLARRQSEAEAILALEGRWSSPGLDKGRELIQETTRRCQSLVESRRPNLSDGVKTEYIGRLMSLWLYRLSRERPEDFREINKILELFETVAVSIYHFRALKMVSVAQLFAGPIIGMKKRVGRYLESRNGPGPRTKGPYEHTLKLFEDVSTWTSER